LLSPLFFFFLFCFSSFFLFLFYFLPVVVFACSFCFSSLFFAFFLLPFFLSFLAFLFFFVFSFSLFRVFFCFCFFLALLFFYAFSFLLSFPFSFSHFSLSFYSPCFFFLFILFCFFFTSSFGFARPFRRFSPIVSAVLFCNEVFASVDRFDFDFPAIKLRQTAVCVADFHVVTHLNPGFGCHRFQLQKMVAAVSRLTDVDFYFYGIKKAPSEKGAFRQSYCKQNYSAALAAFLVMRAGTAFLAAEAAGLAAGPFFLATAFLIFKASSLSLLPEVDSR